MSQRAVTLNRSDWQGVFYVTGGGAGMLAELLGTPGASKSVLEVVVPYAEPALVDLLGRAPEQSCSQATSRALAMAAFQRAQSLQRVKSLQRVESLQRVKSLQRATSPADKIAFGLGCTASLATDRRKRGTHRAWVAVQTASATFTAHLRLDDDRAAEEQSLADLMWHAMSISLDLNLDTPAPASIDCDLTRAPEPWRALMIGETKTHACGEHDGKLLLPGAFNPLHHAHRQMLEMAESKTGLTGAYELSIVNVDKPPLDYSEIESRLRQFKNPVWLTRLPTFLDKARHFPGAHFVVGADTLLRIADPKYYPNLSARDAALAEFGHLECRFIVFGRAIDGEFCCLSDLDLPSALRSICVGIPRDKFHEPVSSTELRTAR